METIGPLGVSTSLVDSYTQKIVTKLASDLQYQWTGAT